jgi:hypothetical protein
MQISANVIPPQNARPAQAAPFSPLDFKQTAKPQAGDTPSAAPPAEARSFMRPGSQVDVKV